MPFAPLNAPLTLTVSFDMKKRLFTCVYVTISLLTFANGFSQPFARVSIVSSPRSIIIKYRTVSAITDSKVLALVQSVSSGADALKPVFRRSPESKLKVQSLASNGIGLDRIVQVPLKQGLSAQDAIRVLSGNVSIEYVQPNYRYHVDGIVIPNDSLFGQQWWLTNIHAPEAWQIIEGDSTVHI